MSRTLATILLSASMLAAGVGIGITVGLVSGQADIEQVDIEVVELDDDAPQSDDMDAPGPTVLDTLGADLVMPKTLVASAAGHQEAVQGDSAER